MNPRYERNIPSISLEEQEALSKKRVLVVGCGGLGGYLIEYLVRLGVGELTAVDGDVFEESNLNRQLLSGEDVLGKSKAKEAEKRAKNTNSSVKVTSVEAFLTGENAESLVQGMDLVLDALDNASSRLILEDACERQGVTIVHGAIEGYMAQVTVSLPGSGRLHQIYGEAYAPGSKTSLSFTPPFCASIQIAEALKILCGKASSLEHALLLANLKRMEWEMIEFPDS